MINNLDKDSVEYSKNCAKKAKEKEVGNFKDTHLSKAIIHSCPARQDEPETPMGAAISRKIFSVNSSIAISFKNWLENLFS